METLVFMEDLWADRCVKLKSIRGLEQATQLLLLNANGCSKLEELNTNGCSQLEELLSMETWCRPKDV